MNKMLAILVGLLLAIGALPATAVADGDKIPPDEVRQAVLKAASLLSAQGIDGARSALYAPGEFKHGELFINVINLSGVWMIFPPKPAAEGRSAIDAKDADGKYLIRGILDIANAKGEGWTDYRWRNPRTEDIQTKVVFLKAVPSRGIVVYASVYK